MSTEKIEEKRIIDGEPLTLTELQGKLSGCPTKHVMAVWAEANRPGEEESVKEEPFDEELLEDLEGMLHHSTEEWQHEVNYVLARLSHQLHSRRVDE